MRSSFYAVLVLASLSHLALSQSKPAPLLAATPPMGWNSWNWFAEKVTDKMFVRPQTCLYPLGCAMLAIFTMTHGRVLATGAEIFIATTSFPT